MNIASIPMLTRPPVLIPLTAIKFLMGPNAFSSLRNLIGVTTVSSMWNLREQGRGSGYARTAAPSSLFSEQK